MAEARGVSAVATKKDAQAAPRPVKAATEPPFSAGLGALAFLMLALYATTHMTASVERFNYVKSYPSRFTWRGLPADGWELVTFLAPDAVKHPLEAAHRWYNPDPRDWSLDKWARFEEQVAWQRLRANIRPEGTAAGCIVASPSTDKPNYW